MSKKKTSQTKEGLCTFCAVAVGLSLLIIFAAVATAAELHLEVIDRKFEADSVEYRVNGNCDQAITYDFIHGAFDEVEDFTGIKFIDAGVHSPLTRDDVNVIGCALINPFTLEAAIHSDLAVTYQDSNLTQADQSSGLGIVYGMTRVWYIIETGRIIEFDMWLNSLFMSQPLLAKQVTRHEAAHAVGLEHSPSEGVMMNAALQGGTIEWDIETIARLSILYGQCEPRFDHRYNLWVPRTVKDGVAYQGLLPRNGVSPDDFQQVEVSRCE